MPNRLLRLTVHDPRIRDVLDSLRGTRKQSAFVVAALRHFLASEEGREQLEAFLALEPLKKPPSEEREEPGTRLEKPREKLPVPKPERPTKTNLDDIFKM